MKAANSRRLAYSLVLGVFLATGCAQYMAIKQPNPYSRACLNPGVKRINVVAELGLPVSSETTTNRLTDGYKYVDGGSKNSGVSKTCRVVLYSAGDLFTLFLDQLIWIPTEKFGFAGTDHSVIIEYTNSPDGSWHAATIENNAIKSHKTPEK